MELEICQGDLRSHDADCVFNAAKDAYLDGGHEVSLAAPGAEVAPRFGSRPRTIGCLTVRNRTSISLERDFHGRTLR